MEVEEGYGYWIDDVLTLPGRIKNWDVVEKSTGYYWDNLVGYKYEGSEEDLLDVWVERCFRLHEVCEALFGILYPESESWKLRWEGFKPQEHLPQWIDYISDIERKTKKIEAKCLHEVALLEKVKYRSLQAKRGEIKEPPAPWWKKVEGFFIRHWQWLIAAIIVPIIAPIITWVVIRKLGH
jgi:hypothetical protein